MPGAASEPPLNSNNHDRDQLENVSTPAQRTGSMLGAADAVQAADSSMVTSHSAQPSLRDAVLLEISQIRADLEQHAATRAPLQAEIDAAGRTMHFMGQDAMPLEGSLPESSQV